MTNDDELTCILILGENCVNNNNEKWSERSSQIDYPTHPPIRRMLNVNSHKFLSHLPGKLKNDEKIYFVAALFDGVTEIEVGFQRLTCVDARLGNRIADSNSIASTGR